MFVKYDFFTREVDNNYISFVAWQLMTYIVHFTCEIKEIFNKNIWISSIYYITLVCFLSSVYSQKSVYAADLMEGFTTCITLVWFLTSVYFKMSVEVADLKEGFTTFIAQVWFLSSVYFNMTL